MYILKLGVFANKNKLNNSMIKNLVLIIFSCLEDSLVNRILG